MSGPGRSRHQNRFAIVEIAKAELRIEPPWDLTATNINAFETGQTTLLSQFASARAREPRCVKFTLIPSWVQSRRMAYFSEILIPLRSQRTPSRLGPLQGDPSHLFP